VCESKQERERERESHTNSGGNRYPEVQRQYNLGVPELQELKNSSKRLTKLQILNVSIVEGSSSPNSFGKGNISVQSMLTTRGTLGEDFFGKS